MTLDNLLFSFFKIELASKAGPAVDDEAEQKVEQDAEAKDRDSGAYDVDAKNGDQEVVEEEAPPVFDYLDPSHKHPLIDPVVHFRTRLIFMALDPTGMGLVEITRLIQALAQAPIEYRNLFQDSTYAEMINRLTQLRDAEIREGQAASEDGIYHGLPAARIGDFYTIMVTAIDATNMREAMNANAQALKAGGPNKPHQGTQVMTQTRTQAIINEEEERRMRKMNCAGRCCYRCGRWWAKHVTDKKHLVPMWKSSIEEIEARFGASTASYFYFARSMFWLNVWLALLCLFIVVPGMMSYDYSLRSYTVERIIGNQVRNVTVQRDYRGIVLGLGMEDSFMFYGDGYKQRYSEYYNYMMDVAWVFVCTAVMLVSLLDNLARFSITEETAEVTLGVCRLAFAQYDFSVRGERAHKLQSMQFSSKLYSSIIGKAEENRMENTRESVGSAYYILKLRRFLGLLFSLAFMGGASLAIIELILNEEQIRNDSRANISTYVAELIVPVCVSALKLMVPLVVKALVDFENYERAKDAFRQTSLRIYLMKMFFVLVVLFQTLALSSDKTRDGTCPQTNTGILYYRMLVIDLAVEFLSSLVIPGVIYSMKRWVCTCIFKLDVPPLKDNATDAEQEKQLYLMVLKSLDPTDLIKNEFRIPENIIELMYKQALVWAAFPFAPVVPILALIIQVLIFIIKKTQVLHLTRMPLKPMGIASQTNMFRSLLLATLALMCIPFSYWLNSTVKCGPHYISKCLTCEQTPVQRLLDWVATLPPTFEMIVSILQNTGLLWIMLLLLMIYGILLTKKYRGQTADVRGLREWLRVEKKEMEEFRRAHRIKSTKSTDLGDIKFRTFLRELPLEIRQLVASMFGAQYFSDLNQLIRLSPEELRILIREWRVSVDISDEDVEAITKKILAYRADIN